MRWLLRDYFTKCGDTVVLQLFDFLSLAWRECKNHAWHQSIHQVFPGYLTLCCETGLIIDITALMQSPSVLREAWFLLSFPLCPGPFVPFKGRVIANHCMFAEVITFILEGNISILMEVVSSRITVPPATEQLNEYQNDVNQILFLSQSPDIWSTEHPLVISNSLAEQPSPPSSKHHMTE